MQIKRIRSDMKYFLILITLGSFILVPIVNVNAASSSRWHVGYYYYGHSASAPDGVMADIYCVSPNIPLFNMMCQWVSIVTSYSPAYWVQVGYRKQFTLFPFIIPFPVVYWSFYSERNDAWGWAQYWCGFPLSTHTYRFLIYLWSYGSSHGNYRWYIHEGGTQLYWGDLIMKYYEPIDLQVMSETTISSISIWTSHFSNIKYRNDSLEWSLWDRHVPAADPPYVLQQISHHEFYAWRG